MDFFQHLGSLSHQSSVTHLSETGNMGSTDRVSTNVDLSHHINAKSKARHPSPLKDIIKYMGYDGMISFAGGISPSS